MNDDNIAIFESCFITFWTAGNSQGKISWSSLSQGQTISLIHWHSHIQYV